MLILVDRPCNLGQRPAQNRLRDAMRLNKSTHDAIKILSSCAGAGGSLLKVADISARLGITLQNVFKIVHILSRAELVVAVRGRNGGVRLGRPAESISIGDIVRAMEGTQIDPEDAARAGTPRVNGVLDSALEAFVAVLDRHSLAEMSVAAARRSDQSATARKQSELPAREPVAKRAMRSSSKSGRKPAGC